MTKITKLVLTNFKDIQGVIDCYIRVFAGPPWNEHWTKEKVRRGLKWIEKNYSAWIAKNSLNQIIGFAWAYMVNVKKLEERLKISLQEIISSKYQVENVVYIADAGVDELYRKTGLFNNMYRKILNEYKGNIFVLRVLAGPTPSITYLIFKKKNFEIIREYKDIDPSDNRVIMAKRI